MRLWSNAGMAYIDHSPRYACSHVEWYSFHHFQVKTPRFLAVIPTNPQVANGWGELKYVAYVK